MLTPREADGLLAEGYERNPGRWADHCRSAAANAKLIAAHVPGMDPDRAYVLALLHDIGRRAGSGRDMLHIFDGYDYMTGLGQPDVARACLTHSFPVKSADMYSVPGAEKAVRRPVRPLHLRAIAQCDGKLLYGPDIKIPDAPRQGFFTVRFSGTGGSRCRGPGR